MNVHRSAPLRFTRPAAPHSGFSLVELAISMGISTLVMVAIAGLQYTSSRSVLELYGQTRTRSSRMQALDQIRYRLIEAKISSVAMSQPSTDGTGFYRVDFIDPNYAGAHSAFYFVAAQRTLFYDRDINDHVAPQAVVVGPIDLIFQTQNGGAMVQLTVKSSAKQAYGDVDVQDGKTMIYIRNT